MRKAILLQECLTQILGVPLENLALYVEGFEGIQDARTGAVMIRSSQVRLQHCRPQENWQQLHTPCCMHSESQAQDLLNKQPRVFRCDKLENAPILL